MVCCAGRGAPHTSLPGAVRDSGKRHPGRLPKRRRLQRVRPHLAGQPTYPQQAVAAGLGCIRFVFRMPVPGSSAPDKLTAVICNQPQHTVIPRYEWRGL